MEQELGFMLFGFFIPKDDLHGNLPSPAMQEQEPQLPSTATLSVSTQPSIPATEIPNPGVKLFGVEIDVPVEDVQPMRVDGHDHHAPPAEAIIKKPKKIIKRPRFRAPDPQGLPPNYRNFLLEGGVDEGTLKLILTRRLHATDTSDHHARLSMPCKQVRQGFLRHGEEKLIGKGFKGGKRELRRRLDLTVVDPSLVIHEMKLTKWNSEVSQRKGRKKSWWYALTNDWMKLVRDNGLAVGHAIQVWSFRIPGGDLGFLIHKIEPAAAGSSSMVSDGSQSFPQEKHARA